MSQSQTRRIAKWVGVGVSAFMAGSWLVSHRYEVGYTYDGGGIILVGGCYVTTYDHPIPSPPGHFYCTEARIRFISWGPTYDRDARLLVLPIWVLFLLVAAPTAWLWRRDQRHPPGHCQNCGYDLTGNVTGVCSECATEVTGP